MSQRFTEAKLEQVFIDLLKKEGYPHHLGNTISRLEDEVIIEKDLKDFLSIKYSLEKITDNEIEKIIHQIKNLSSSNIYDSNKKFMDWLTNGFILNREDENKKDILIHLVDSTDIDNNNFKFINQLEIVGSHRRIPDGIVYINGIPLVVIEFKSAIREEATIHNAYTQLTERYKRDIPQLFIYNSFCIISDGINNKAGSFFAPYEFYYAWRRISGTAKAVDGIDSIFTLAEGMFNKLRLLDIIQNFIYLPDSSKKNEKILCRYPQYYAARALYNSIKKAQKKSNGKGGDGKGGTYFGATGSGKSFTMLFLSRLLMRSKYFSNPTIILITDRTDLDDQLSSQFTNAKNYIGDNGIISVESRNHLRQLIQDCESGGVFLTTIQKFTEDIKLLSNRTNVICISDEAHRTQTNLEQRVQVTEKSIKKTYGFAKYLHDSLPNATFVGFTGTPIDATLDVFGDIVDLYTMSESVNDDITVRIVYEGRAAKVILKNKELEKIEKYYEQAAAAGANQYQIDESKKQSANMDAILSDPDVLERIATDFINHYSNRVIEGASVKGKAMFVCSSRSIAYAFYKKLISIKPEWAVVKQPRNLNESERKKVKPMSKVKMVMTRGQDDPKELYDLIGSKEYRKELDRQFKNDKSNFKIAIVVDMWLTGFDVPSLDSIYIYKPIQHHNLIQTISRVNRKFSGKNKGLVIDYIGIKKAMNLALAKFNPKEKDNFEDIEISLVTVKNHLELLADFFHKFDSEKYFNGTELEQLKNLNKAAEYVQVSQKSETKFMGFVKRLKAAYDICAGSDDLTQQDRDYVHFYLAIRSIIFKLTKGEAPDTAQMNKKVAELIKDALQSDGVEELFRLGDDKESSQDIFDEDYLAKIKKIKLPNTKIKLLQKLLEKAIDEIKKANKIKGIDFSKKMESVVNKYNERKEEDILRSEVYEEIADELTEMILSIRDEFNSGDELGINFEEKAFYDILLSLCIKYDFSYPEDKLITLSKSIKELVDEQVKFPDWNKREDIKSALKVGLILELDKHGYPPVERDEVYDEIFEQAESFMANNL